MFEIAALAAVYYPNRSHGWKHQDNDIEKKQFGEKSFTLWTSHSLRTELDGHISGKK